MIDKQSIEDVLVVNYYIPQTGAEVLLLEQMRSWKNKEGKLLTASEYSDWVEGMIVTSGQTRMIENTLGLVGEAGEFAEKVKKVFRDNTFDRDLILKELGDVVFYAAALANYFGSDLQEVMDINVAKLEDRKARNVLQGSGDNR